LVPDLSSTAATTVLWMGHGTSIDGRQRPAAHACCDFAATCSGAGTATTAGLLRRAATPRRHRARGDCEAAIRRLHTTIADLPAARADATT
jgi:hypothetical protein